MPTFVITGCNRGLGFEFVRQLVPDKSNTVLATTRKQSAELNELAISNANLHVLVFDVSNLSTISGFSSAISHALGTSSFKIDFLLNNAGINIDPEQDVLHLDPSLLQISISTNVQTPAEVVKVLEPYLQSGSVVMNMTSRVASMHNMKTQGFHVGAPYAISKAAVNMLTVMQAKALKEKGVSVICVDPGHAKTAMGGDEAPLEPEESIEGVLKVLQGVKLEDTAKFYMYDGSEVPW